LSNDDFHRTVRDREQSIKLFIYLLFTKEKEREKKHDSTFRPMCLRANVD